jgi:SAM-dependent methyltransferase
MSKRKAVVDLREAKADTPQAKALESSAQDLGHRLGNFHNYYAFNPTSHRLSHMKEILEHICKHAPSPAEQFQYCDLGCNEGDLTLEMSHALPSPVHFVGIDIDPVLVERAKKKDQGKMNVTGEFHVGDICKDLDKLIKDNSMDLISLLSTTMWIHVHAGDDGLKAVLKQICQKTKRFLLIEPQPSKCYRKAMTRLRKIGRPELNVSSDRLKLRPNVEEEIDAILQWAGFDRVAFSNQEKTEWNRTLELYERKA